MEVSRSPEQWRALARQAILSFVEKEGAFVPLELEAKLSERRWEGFPTINPHHLTSALVNLRGRELELTSASTRGGAQIPVYTRTGPSKAVQRKAGRKRLLQTRYLSWSRPSKDWDPPPLPSGLERVVHSSLLEAAPYGYTVVNPRSGEVRKILGRAVPGGSLDNAAFFTGLSSDGAPSEPTAVLIEAKNLRGWIYSRTQELYQVLDKAVSLQQAHPNRRFVPVLVCRRLHYTAAGLARQLGVHVIETKTQYVRPVVVPEGDADALRKVDEVRLELGYDITLHDGSTPQMVRQFTTTLPSRIDEAATRWRTLSSNPAIPSIVAELRQELTPWSRHESLVAFVEAVKDTFTEGVNWGPDDDTPF